MLRNWHALSYNSMETERQSLQQGMLETTPSSKRREMHAIIWDMTKRHFETATTFSAPHCNHQHSIGRLHVGAANVCIGATLHLGNQA
ncbi:hypothetical protein Hypma_005069 [Hypsizygus marmoreus]|uniref:Uncharacterized protein n=1 Tax=Hypsizygus marmoreus TaxID=39966 RepID=A0A369K2H1_HYPMA|nr:hypothetical protein Hypma_005069 [Hypsizygus marmoreus]